MLRLRALAALAALVAAPGPLAVAWSQEGGAPTGPAAAGALVPPAKPNQRKLSVRIGDDVEFTAELTDDATAHWRLDGTPVATGPAWTFAPGAADVGHHVVVLEVRGRPGRRATRRWDVRVAPPRLPRVSSSSPTDDTVSVEVDREVVLRFDARPATPGETVRILWSVDGAPAGEGDTLKWRAREPANVRARALAIGSLGAAVGREWRILARFPPTTTTTIAPTRVAGAPAVEPLGPLPPSESTRGRPETRPERGPASAEESEAPSEEPQEEPDARESERSARRTGTTLAPSGELARTEPPASVPAPTTLPPQTVPPSTALQPPTLPPSTLPPAPPPPPPPPTIPTGNREAPQQLASRGADTRPGGMEEEVRRLLDRYAAAWRNHDLAELRRIGQVTSESQAADLGRYFAKVEDLDVEVNVIDIRPEGDRATVRFTRRDRFRDPAGRLVTQESPPIEKRVVRSPDGLRFEPGAR